MPNNITILLLLFFIFAFCLAGNGVHAFGAGNIPSKKMLAGSLLWRGERSVTVTSQEDTLAELLKKGAGGFALTNLLSKGTKFGGLDIKRVYFGNWLRDYSQAVDIGTLKKLQVQTIINLCMVLGFMAHGYATNEFEVTEDRLAVYLPTEHIDNPKGYGEGEDPRKYHPKLRGPVDPRELDFDPRTGMKNYIANENGPWDTSKALVRRTLEQCVRLGRQYRSTNQKQDLYEAYRLLGQALHTLEDFPAHSNFCELALVAQGNHQVFVHIGDSVRVQAPGGKWVAPLATGTFGSSDFLHSLLGEATDHISEASVSDLNKELDRARSKSMSSGSSPVDSLRDLLFNIPGGGGGEMTREMEGIERIRAGPSQGGKRPEDMNPQEVHAVLWQVLSFRDSVMKKIEMTIEKIPGLGSLIEKLTESISVFVFTTLEPFLKPIMKTATTGLQSASGEVINTHDQYEVFNDPRASDPTHSFLSKDHFNLILNEPAGHLAKIILTHTVNWVIKAWDDTSVNVNQAIDDILQCLFHPDFHDPNSKVQREMMQYMNTWVQGLGNKRTETLNRLSKESVRSHQNIRLAGEGGPPAAQGSYAYNQGTQMQQNLQGYAAQIPGVSQAQSLLGRVSGGPPGSRRDVPSPGPFGRPTGTPPPSTSHQHSHYHGPPPPATGEAASYYSETVSVPGGRTSSYQSTTTYATPGAAYAPPSGPPPSGFAPPNSSYAPPGRGEPPFPGANSPYASSNAPSYSSPPPGPSFPGAQGGYAPQGGFPPPAGPPGSFPSPGGPPGHHHHGGPPHGGHPPHGGPPGGPGFPDAHAYGGQPPQFPSYPPPPSGPYNRGW
ncbi:Het-C-domain-containing protein [Leucogyrophana mollusca]|uniref:Het-C-domain-containing protein n=1 Tax=Leucogyrophana mollusca TaxID=85980 RepID=A0ACB8B305_9AGAM|nr:Het-C-domain-containing protein [Leucogyrophana mollusca]